MEGSKELFMAMLPCFKCLGRLWSYQYDDESGIVTAKCQSCEHEVQFLSKRAKRIQKGERIGTGLSTLWENRDGQLFVDGVRREVKINEKGWVKLVRN